MIVRLVWRSVVLAIGLTVFSCGAMLRADDEAVPVKVGGYQFEPFVEGSGGLSVAFAKFLSEQQAGYQFEFVKIPARRRYDLLVSGKIDMIFFELPLWGWSELADEIVTSTPLIKGQEVFVARRDNPLGRDVFDALHKRRIALTFGFHYAFAGLTSDPDEIRARYDVVFAQQQLYTLRHLISGNADLAVLNDLFLARQLETEPELGDVLRVGERVDQRYELPVLMRRNGPVSQRQMNDLLAKVMEDGRFARFLAEQEAPASAIMQE
ncbi:substrate-binding periplasmic protein [Kordiimonas gwangyangensis]|uniref:substrate-binding periplasmic protein n=1 Tax=Kordiimonas gwangyangensis TaxID=288022 RepID=UPI0012DDE762|nr:transporter substrate-binding domain-containing protein [Kordiimonas gwangyangensis]